MKKLINQLQAYRQTRPNRSKAILAALAILAIILILAALTQPDTTRPTTATITPPAPTAQITITAAGFEPATVTVKQGTIITWTNTDTAIHQIQANPHPTGTSLPSLKSEVLNNQQTYTYTATQTGSYGYHDQLNPTINGQIDVKD